jgi:hypothetical protein
MRLAQNLRELLAQKAKPLAHWNAALQKKLRIQKRFMALFCFLLPVRQLVRASPDP